MKLFNFNKVGKGIPKEPDDQRFFLFFRLLSENFFKIILLNLLFALTLVVSVGLVLLMSFVYNNIGNVLLKIALLVLMYVVAVLPIGPAVCGIVKVMRNIVRGEYTATVGDFFSTFRSNFKQGALIGFINITALLLLVVSTIFYLRMAVMNPLMYVPAVFGIIIILIFFIMQYNIYILSVTFFYKIKNLYYNSMLLALTTPIPALITTLVALALAFLVFIMIPVIQLLLVLVIVPAILMFVATFNAYPAVKKFLLDSVREQNKKDNNTPLFKDTISEKGTTK